MKIRRLLLVFTIVCMLLCACGTPAEEVEDTAAPTVTATEPAAEPTEPELQSQVVFPDKDEATGALLFYFGEYKIHAGAPMSDVLAMGIYTDQDLSAIVQPGRTSEVITVRVDLEDQEQDDDPLIFIVAINASEEPRMVSQCMIYSITVNTESGIRFGSGNETEPFVTGTTTKDEIVAAYGEPGFSRSGDSKYVEIAYYQPFNSAYFTFKNGVVRQIVTTYSAYLYGETADDFKYDLSSTYFGADCAILMNQYLDVVPYLDGTVEAEKLTALEESIVMADQTITFGMEAAQMPSPFGEHFVDLPFPLNAKYYVRTGRGNEEEFYLINWSSSGCSTADRLQVKGVITENRNYCSWGIDNSAFHEFQYMGLTGDSNIEQILEVFGMPKEIQFNSNGRLCDAWLFYEDVNGNTLNIRVDPMLNQLVELRVVKHYSGEHYYS